MMVHCCLRILSGWLLVALVGAQEAPRVVRREPAHRDAAVDARLTTRLRVVFDQPMQAGSYSFVGGGEAFPELRGKPQWLDDRTIEVEVALRPGRSYALGLNSGKATGFRAVAGTPLAPVAWTFCTLPDPLPEAAAQADRNAAAWTQLCDLLDAHYSYRDRCVRDWAALRRAGAATVQAARSDVEWASLAAAALGPTQDQHLSLVLGDTVFPIRAHEVDPLFRRAQVARLLDLQPTKTNAMWARTADGIGYLCVGSLIGLDVDEVERALAQLASAKALVLDLRPNGGGDERLAQRIAAWFVDGTRVYARHRVRLGPGPQGFSAVAERVVVGNADPARRFRGPLAVLISPWVLSSCESFVLMLAQAPDCTLVGQRTGGSSGNPKPFPLANGVVARVPSWEDLRPDGSCFEGEGLAPTVEVACTPADCAGGDPILQRALALLAARLAGPAAGK